MQNNVVIQKLKVDIYLGTHANPQDFLDQSTSEIKEVVMPLVLKQLASYDFGGESVVFDKINIEIQHATLQDWTTSVGEGVSQALVQRVNEVQYANDETKADGDFHGHEALPQLGESIEGKLYSKTERLVSMMEYFLREGILPWWRASLDIHTFHDLQKVWLAEKIAANDVARFGAFLRENSKTIARLVRNSDDAFLSRCIQCFTDTTTLGFVENLLASSAQMGVSIKQRKVVYQTILSFGVHEKHQFIALEEWLEVFPVFLKTAPQAAVVLQQMESILKNRLHGDSTKAERFVSRLETLVTKCNQVLGNKTTADEIESIISKMEYFLSNGMLKTEPQAAVILQQMKSILKNGLSGHSAKEGRFASKLETLVTKCNQVLENVSFVDELKKNKSKVMEEPTYADYAGIVLLNPFFPALFKNLEYLNDQNQWADEAKQVEAIYLLHYLATANEEPTEDELFVAKLLVGFPLDEVLPQLENEHPFSNSEKLEQEMAELLTAIQDNWKPMKNCTWIGLRNDFLNRPAKISQTDNMQYVLTVEPNALDVLLPFKKWGISMIKYSWIEDVINVVWV